MLKYFTKEQLYVHADEKGVKGSWQDKWGYFGCLFFTLFEGGVALIDFPQSSSPNVYVKVGEEFFLVGNLNQQGDVEITYQEELFGKGEVIGYVELPSIIEVRSVEEGGKGIVGTEWLKKRENNGMLGKEKFIPYKEWERWEGKKVKFRIDLRKYKRYEVRGENWERMFEIWEEKRKDSEAEFFFRIGLKYADRFPPRRKLGAKEWREYVIMLGEHFHWLERIREEKEDRELRKLVWGRDEIEENEWEGLSIYVPPISFVGISGPISLDGLLRFIQGDMSGVLERYISKYTVPIPCL
ncbi:MAG: hypothetical protein QW733_07855 [Desulfurococcaceae archaeon]